MFGSLFALLLSSLMVWLVYRLKSKTGVAPEERRWLALFLAFFALVLLVNMLFTYMGLSSLRWLANNAPLSSIADIPARAVAEPFIIEGKISSANERAFYDYVAYIDENGFRHLPSEMTVEVADGGCKIINNDFEARNWRWDSFRDAYYLLAEDEVIIVGEKAHEAGGPTPVRAVVVYGGDAEEFAGSAQFKMIPALVLLIANLAGVGVIIRLIFKFKLAVRSSEG